MTILLRRLMDWEHQKVRIKNTKLPFVLFIPSDSIHAYFFSCLITQHCRKISVLAENVKLNTANPPPVFRLPLLSQSQNRRRRNRLSLFHPYPAQFRAYPAQFRALSLPTFIPTPQPAHLTLTSPSCPPAQTIHCTLSLQQPPTPPSTTLCRLHRTTTAAPLACPLITTCKSTTTSKMTLLSLLLPTTLHTMMITFAMLYACPTIRSYRKWVQTTTGLGSCHSQPGLNPNIQVPTCRRHISYLQFISSYFPCPLFFNMRKPLPPFIFSFP